MSNKVIQKRKYYNYVARVFVNCNAKKKQENKDMEKRRMR